MDLTFWLMLATYNTIKSHEDLQSLDFKLLTSLDEDFPITKLNVGDLIVRKALDNNKFFHAGIYCGDNEVIHFTSPDTSTQSSSSWSCSSCQLSSDQKGLVNKISVKKFSLNQTYYVLRLKNGPPQDISLRISEAMDDYRDYNLFTNNCWHFALRVLGYPESELESEKDHMLPQDVNVDALNARSLKLPQQRQETTFADL